MRKIRKNIKKLNSKKILGLTSLVLVGTLMTSCANVGLRKQHQYTRTEFTSDGEYKETRQFQSFDSNCNRDLDNSFIYYGEWIKVEEKYQREVKEYSVKGRTYEELKDVVVSNEKTEEFLGEPSKEYIQISDYISEEEIKRGSYTEVTLYTEDVNKVVYVKDEGKNVWVLGIAGIVIPTAVGAAIAWNKHEEKREAQEKKLTLKK